VAAKVGFRHKVGEMQLTLANQPELLIEPLERHLMVIAPEGSVEIMVPGLVVP
jgi:hypothetical protein